MSRHSRPSKVTSFVGAAVATACAAMPAAADEFSWQLSGGTRQVEVGGFDSHSWSVDSTYFVNPIDDSAGPYALASFLNPSTRISAEASERDSGSDIVGDTAYTLRGTYVLPGARWYAGASYAMTDEDYTSPFYSQSDQKGYGVLAGRYLGPNTTLELGFGTSQREFETQLGCPIGVPACPPVLLSVETTTDSVGLEIFHVRRFRSLTYSLQGRVSESDADVDIGPGAPTGVLLPSGGDALRVYSVAGELYPTDRLSVRIGYSQPDGGSSFSSDRYDLAATWFFKPRIAVQFALGHSKVEGASAGFGESDSAAVRFIGRL